MSDTTIFETAGKLYLLKEEKKELEARVKELNGIIEKTDKELSDEMAEGELESFNYKGHTFYLNNRLFASPAKDRKEDMLQALKDNGFGDLVTESVNSQTLASFIKEQRELTGMDVPEWLGDTVTVFEKVTVGIRKA